MDDTTLREAQIIEVLTELKRVWFEFPQFSLPRLITLIIRNGKAQYDMTDNQFLAKLRDPTLTIKPPSNP